VKTKQRLGLYSLAFKRLMKLTESRNCFSISDEMLWLGYGVQPCGLEGLFHGGKKTGTRDAEHDNCH
jgi:hypothetical protein